MIFSASLESKISLILFALQDKELWEDETITYACKNETFSANGKDKMIVIDNTKGVYTVSYKCMDDGTYDTPKGLEEGDPWPECTLKPIDPCK